MMNNNDLQDADLKVKNKKDGNSSVKLMNRIISVYKSTIEEIWQEIYLDNAMHNAVKLESDSNHSCSSQSITKNLINEIHSLALANKRDVYVSLDFHDSIKVEGNNNIGDIIEAINMLIKAIMNKGDIYVKCLLAWKKYLEVGASFVYFERDISSLNIKLLPATACIWDKEATNGDLDFFLFEEAVDISEARNLYPEVNEILYVFDKTGVTFDTFLNNSYSLEFYSSTDQGNEVLDKEQFISIERDGLRKVKRVKIAKENVKMGMAKLTTIIKRVNVRFQGSYHKSYEKHILINNEFVCKTVHDKFPIISFLDFEKNDDGSPELRYPSLFRCKRTVVDTYNYISEKILDAISSSLNGTTFISKNILSDKAIEDRDLIGGGIVKIDPTKLIGSQQPLANFIYNTPKSSIDMSLVQYLQLLKDDLRAFCGLTFYNSKENPASSGYQESLRLDREASTLNSLQSIVDNNIKVIGEIILDFIISLKGNSSILKKYAEDAFQNVDVDEFIEILTIIRDNINIDVQASRYSDNYKAKTMGELRMLAELTGGNLGLDIVSLANIIGVDKRAIEQIQQANVVPPPQPSQIVDIKVKETKALEQIASANLKNADANLKNADANLKIKEITSDKGDSNG